MAQWSAHEDEQLRKLVKEYGPKRWSIIASKLKTKGSKQCRRRWKNHLNADLKSGGWTAEEDRILMEGHRLYGNKWTEIAKMVGGRTDNAVKNRYAAICKRDSKGAARGGAARGGRGGRKARASDSDAGASDIEVEDDSDEEDVKRTSSSSVSRDPSPVRGGGRGHAAVDSAGNHSTPPQRGAPSHLTSPPLAKAAAAAPAVDTEAMASVGMRSSVLGRRRQAGGGSPPLQPEPEAAGPGKRRAVQQVLGGGVSRHPVATTPQTPLVQMPQLHQPQEALLAAYQQQQQHQQRQVPERIGRSGLATAGAGRMFVPEEDVSDDTAEELSPPPPPRQQQHVLEQAELVRRASSGGREVDAVACGQPKKLPLTINIPNAASAEPHAVQPPSATATVYGIEIRVLKDLLTPCEIQYARELNDMQLPLHINVDEDPSTLAGRGGALVLEPPLTTSRQAAQNALTALFSPGSAVGSAAADFNDVLKWFQTGLTPRSACGEDITPRLMSRMGLTPCGLSGSGRSGHCVEDAGMLGTGLTPKCLRDSGSPRSLSSGGGGGSMGGLTPHLAELSAAKRARRQIAVAAAVAAAANEIPPALQQEQRHANAQAGNGGLQGVGSGVPLSTAGGSGATALEGMTSPGGMELHAGHRQLLTKLIQTAAAADASAQGGGAAAAGGGGSTTGGAVGGADGGRLRNELPSPSAGLITPEPLPGRGSLTRNISGAAGPDADGAAYPGQQVSGAPSAGVVVMPYFSQQELLLLLEVLNSDDLQALPPPPMTTTATATQQ